MVRLMRAPQLNAELRGTLEAASVRDGVHNDIGTARLQARILAPAFILQQSGPRPILQGYRPLNRRVLAEKAGAGMV